jgi:uncharacterized membrane protein
MSLASGHSAADDRVEHIVGNLLRVGVLLAATVAAIAAMFFLARHGGDPAQYHVFHGEPGELSTLTGIMHGVLALNSRAVVQFGIILLIATPIARVLLTLVAFALRRDWLYVVVSGVVLGALLFGLIGG